MVRVNFLLDSFLGGISPKSGRIIVPSVGVILCAVHSDTRERVPRIIKPYSHPPTKLFRFYFPSNSCYAIAKLYGTSVRGYNNNIQEFRKSYFYISHRQCMPGT